MILYVQTVLTALIIPGMYIVQRVRLIGLREERPQPQIREFWRFYTILGIDLGFKALFVLSMQSQAHLTAKNIVSTEHVVFLQRNNKYAIKM